MAKWRSVISIIARTGCRDPEGSGKYRLQEDEWGILVSVAQRKGESRLTVMGTGGICGSDMVDPLIALHRSSDWDGFRISCAING